MGYGRLVEGVALSPEYKISPIPFGGLETILKAIFTTVEVKSKYLNHLKELIKKYYEPLINLGQLHNGEICLSNMEQHAEKKDKDNLEMD